MFLSQNSYLLPGTLLFSFPLANLTTLTKASSQGLESVLALSRHLVSASIENLTGVTRDLMATHDPYAFCSVAIACAKPRADVFIDYQQHLKELLACTEAMFANATDE